MSLQTNQTLYVRNLNEKIKKEDLRRLLYLLFSQYGRVAQVIALKTMKMRGQSHIVFQDAACATAAMRALQGFVFYGKPIKIQYAKTMSNMVKVFRLANGLDAEEAMLVPPPPPPFPGTAKRPNPEEPEEGTAKLAKYDPENEEDEMELEEEETSSILFLQQLPPDVQKHELMSIFQSCVGFKELRLVPTKPDIAFVEFQAERFAEMAKEHLNGQSVSGVQLNISFAKK